MPGKAKGPELRLEVPDHHVVVKRARDELPHVGIEADRGGSILVAAEGALKRRVLRLWNGVHLVDI